MRQRMKLLILMLVTTLIVSACSGIQSLGVGSANVVEIQIVYGSEKQEWLNPLIESFNNERNKIESGAVVRVSAVPMGSIESVRGIIEGRIQPTVWSPASSVYVPIANAEWRRSHSEDLVLGTPRDLVLSPVVIAMWKPMAEALGWPGRAIGWADIADMAISDDGWAGMGYPEWGSFKFGHTHPEFSNSGVVAVIAQAYSGADKQRGLTLDDLKRPEVGEFMRAVQRSIIHYGSSTGFFAHRMFDRGPSYLSAAVLYENLVVEQETRRLTGQFDQIPVVAIYPKEGTFWSNHPYIVLNAPWVSAEQRAAAELFEQYLLSEAQQKKAIELGFRPSDPTIPLTSPLDVQHGVDVQQPKTVLEIPTSEVIEGIEALWKQVKKPVDLVVVVDVSGSMFGKKIASARSSLVEFINLLDDRDRLQVVLFSSDVVTLSPLSDLGPKRQDLLRRVSGIIEGGDTSLYDAVAESYNRLVEEGDPKHIRAVVVLSDGNDTTSVRSLQNVMDEIGLQNEQGGNAVKLFTIAYGDDADGDVLKKLAEATGGKLYFGKPETINDVYGDIATFF
jgi:Ca-activated chloride channel homolog